MMEYIDAAMVGRLGALPAASIGLVMTCTWLFFGFSMAMCQGFSVQVAHLCGARDFANARKVLRQGLVTVFGFGLLLSLVAVLIARPLPMWLGGAPEIRSDATAYFLIYMLFLPISAVGVLSSSCLQASGNMKIPSIFYVSMCVLDVVFNYIFIFRLGLGVKGAALGTGLSELLTSIFGVTYTLYFSKELSIRGERGSFMPRRGTLSNAWSITGPMWLQNVVLRGAYVMGTFIIAPLGPISIAANSFAVTAESFCYLPGYGIEESCTSLVGQSLGAGRRDEASKFARISIVMAVVVMSLLAVVMYVFAHPIMAMLNTDPDVVDLGARVLRVEAFAEAFYAVSIVAYGACVGAGNTLAPSLINFLSMWLVRIVPAFFLVPRMGLMGFWIAMCVELNVRGIVFLLYMRRGSWMKSRLTKNEESKQEIDYATD